MIDDAAACLDIIASKNHKIIASQSISIPKENDATTNTATTESNPVNTASFGHYRGNDRIIYRHEISQ